MGRGWIDRAQAIAPTDHAASRRLNIAEREAGFGAKTDGDVGRAGVGCTTGKRRGAAAFAKATGPKAGMGEVDEGLEDKSAVEGELVADLTKGLGTVDPTSTHAFSGGSGFTVAGASLPQGAAIIEAGLDFNLNPNIDLGVAYDGQISSALQQHGVKANLSVKF